MIKKLMSIMLLMHEKGLDQNGRDSLKEQIPYWTDLLDEEYGSFDYPEEVRFIKGLGYRVFRNSDGKHKLVYESETIEL